MLAHALRHAPNARTNGSAPIVRRPSPSHIAIMAIAYLWLALVGALFAHWLATSGSPSAGGSAADAACVSLGRGGALCDPAATAPMRKPETGLDDSCVSLGRGGRLCRQ